MSVSQAWHSHVDIISLHDAAEVLISGEDPVEAVVVDVSYNHLGGGGGAKSVKTERVKNYVRLKLIKQRCGMKS